MYLKINSDGSIVYPYSLNSLLVDNPNVSFVWPITDELAADFGVFPVSQVEPLPFDRTTEKIVEGTPEQVNDLWQQVWTVVQLSDQERVEIANQIKQEIVSAAQQRLDQFAQTREYDSILSACTYATSSVAKFQTEGQYCVGARDATWTKLYQILADVQAGSRPMPASYADIEAELPTLEWPL